MAKDICWIADKEDEGDYKKDDERDDPNADAGTDPNTDTTTDPTTDARRDEGDNDGEDEPGEWEAACMRALRLLRSFDEYQTADEAKKKELTEAWSDAIGEILGDGATSLAMTSATALTAAFAILSF